MAKTTVQAGMIAGTALALAACGAAHDHAHEGEAGPDRASEVVGFSDITAAQEGWGTFYPHFTGETPATRDLLVGVADIRPSYLIHPPHRHAEEEFLMVIEGEGTWSLNGEEFPAKAGDILYAAPWEIHGIENTGGQTLRFVVFKYNPQGVAVPEDPNPELGEFGLEEAVE